MVCRITVRIILLYHNEDEDETYSTDEELEALAIGTVVLESQDRSTSVAGSAIRSCQELRLKRQATLRQTTVVDHFQAKYNFSCRQHTPATRTKHLLRAGHASRGVILRHITCFQNQLISQFE